MNAAHPDEKVHASQFVLAAKLAETLAEFHDYLPTFMDIADAQLEKGLHMEMGETLRAYVKAYAGLASADPAFAGDRESGGFAVKAESAAQV
jgi:hypothetical protein